MRRLPVAESRTALYEPMPPTPESFTGPGAFELSDSRGRRYTYLRLSVTDRCDLACLYCMPPSGEVEHALRGDLLDFNEASRLARVFSQCGIRRIRLTGGEPLVRKDVTKLVRMIHEATQIDDLVMTTNAMRLGELAPELRDAGLSGVNISLDSLDPERFRRLTRGGDLDRVLSGIRAALDCGMRVKLNTVLIRGETDGEAVRLVDFAWDLGVTPRFIELMPLGEGARLPLDARVSAAEVIEQLGSRLGDWSAADENTGPARYRVARAAADRRVGFITAVSDDFCGSCNRVRVTAKGDIRACLASRRAVSLRDIMRAGGDDRDLAWAMHWSLNGKAPGHFFGDDAVDEHENVGMSLIGG